MTLEFINKYEIVSTLGKGSMGVVYKARDPEIGRLVALKTLKSFQIGNDPAGNEALQRFRQESRSAGRLHHPNIVTIFEAGKTEDGSPFIVMEYIEGRSFEALIAERGAIDPLETLHYLAQIASAVDYAHSQNVIHRDIKPSNILVDGSYRPHLLDFGVAKLSDTSLTPAGTVVGTPSYMSPEQIRGEQLDGRSDLFSFAVVAFELFTGVRPFTGKDFTTVVGNIIHKEPVGIHETGVNLPVALEPVLRQALSKRREERFMSGLEFVDALAEVLGVVVDGSGIAGGYDPRMTLAGSVADRQLTEKRTEIIGRERVEELRQEYARDGGPNAALRSWQEARATMSGQKELSPEKRARVSDTRGTSTDSFRKLTEIDPDRTMMDEIDQELLKRRSSVFRPLIIFTGAVAIVAAAGVVALKFLPPGKQPTIQGLLAGTMLSPASSSSSADLEPVDPAPSTPTLVEPPRPVRPLEPAPPPGGFTQDGIAQVSDADLGWFLNNANYDSKTLELMVAEAGRRGNASYLNGLAKLSAHPTFQVRVQVLKAIATPAYAPTAEAFLVMRNLLNDPEFIVRGFAAKGLGLHGGADADEALAARAREEEHKVVLDIIKKSIVQVRRSAPVRGPVR